MSDFTEHERIYIENFNSMRDEIPVRDVSVFQQPLTTREELLNTILCKWEGTRQYRLANELRFTDPTKKKMLFGKMRMYYHPSSFPFWECTSEKEFSDTLCYYLNDYMKVLPEYISIPFPDVQSKKREFLHHYDKSIELLLHGPPHANHHEIDSVLAEEWISAQKTPERKRLAKRLIDNTIYISHSDLLSSIQDCVRKTHAKIQEGPIVFCTGSKEKSNYYICLLFYHFWKEAGFQVDFVIESIQEIVQGNIIDIDDMAYSGSQTTRTLAFLYGKIIDEIRNSCKKQTRNSIAKTPNFIPLSTIEYYLYRTNIHYFVVRMFCGEVGKRTLTTMPPEATIDNRAKLPFDLIIGREIPSPQTILGEEDFTKLALLFDYGYSKNNPSTIAYFNHKIADAPSTFLYALGYGIVPDKLFMEEESIQVQPNKKEIVQKWKNEIQKESTTDDLDFIPFLRFCGKNGRQMPARKENLINYFPPGEKKHYRNIPKGFPQEYLCPLAFYKYIDYDTGTYHPPTLEKNTKKNTGNTGKRKTRKVSVTR